MNFKQALAALLDGKKVYRKGVYTEEENMWVKDGRIYMNCGGKEPYVASLNHIMNNWLDATDFEIREEPLTFGHLVVGGRFRTKTANQSYKVVYVNWEGNGRLMALNETLNAVVSIQDSSHVVKLVKLT